MTAPQGQIGSIGLGVMGEPICRNLAVKSRHSVTAFDSLTERVEKLTGNGVIAAKSCEALFETTDTIFLSLPSGEIVENLLVDGGLINLLKPGQIVIDLGTSPVELTRSLSDKFQARGAEFVDAPVARTRAAAETGTLSVMIGAEQSVYEKIRPLIETFASEITLCGPVGCGQVVKILNNAVLFQIGVAISEAKSIGEKAGVPAALLFDTLAKGSADSFALRNHGMKAIVPDMFPEKAFSATYARKDLKYALDLANTVGIDPKSAKYVDTLFEKAINKGFGQHYWPVISKFSV